jgi:hypothetical protein
MSGHVVITRRPALLVSGIVVTIASVQLSCALGGTLSPWKGGGFGMFASIDSPTDRFLSIVAFGESGEEYAVDVPFGRFRRPETLSTRYRSYTVIVPSQGRVTNLAATVLAADLLPSRPERAQMGTGLVYSRYALLINEPGVQRKRLTLLSPLRLSRSLQNIREVRVQVMRVSFDTKERRAVLEAVGPVGVARTMAASSHQ